MDNFNNKSNDNLDNNDAYFGFDENAVTEETNEANKTNELNNNINVNTSDENDIPKSYESNKKHKKSKKSFKKPLAVIAGGLVCAMLGGIVGGFSVAYAIRNTNNYTNTPITNTNTQFAGEEGALTVPQVVQKVAPAVVGVSTKSIVSGNSIWNPQQEQEGLGSGFIISEDGLVVTNYHVISGASEVKVILNDGTEVNAKVVNYDAQQDMAVVKITDDIKVPGVAELGDSSILLAGEEVIAIGNPLGKEFSETVTKGIISSANRKLNTAEGVIQEYVQIDAAINPGNSGGPLINSKGQVIGINTAKQAGTGIEGIGFSIPINKVKEKLDVLSKPILLLGISARDVNEELAKANGLEEGVYVVDVQEFSPAETAGLKIGDLITNFGGQRVKTTDELNTIKQQYNEGDVVKMTILRDGKQVSLDVKLKASN